jgi:hypothetical protein
MKPEFYQRNRRIIINAKSGDAVMIMSEYSTHYGEFRIVSDVREKEIGTYTIENSEDILWFSEKEFEVVGKSPLVIPSKYNPV